MASNSRMKNQNICPNVTRIEGDLPTCILCDVPVIVPRVSCNYTEYRNNRNLLPNFFLQFICVF